MSELKKQLILTVAASGPIAIFALTLTTNMQAGVSAAICDLIIDGTFKSGDDCIVRLSKQGRKVAKKLVKKAGKR